jgi:uncharacterized membrane protein
VQVERTVEVDAPAEAVWAVLEEVRGWPQWTASMSEVEPLADGPLAVGSEVRVKQPRLPAAVWEVTELEPGRSFTWVNRSPGMTSTGEHAIEPAGERCVVRLRFTQAGPLSVLALPFLPLTKRYVDLEAQGLKRRAEQR